MSGMSTNKKKELFIKFMIIFMEDATDIRAALKPCFGGSVKKLKDTLAELGFANAQYSDGSSSEKHPPKIYAVDPSTNVFPNTDLFETFKENGNSWFFLDRTGVKSYYMQNKLGFAAKLTTLLRDPESKKSVIDFNVMAHKTFDFCPGP